MIGISETDMIFTFVAPVVLSAWAIMCGFVFVQCVMGVWKYLILLKIRIIPLVRKFTVDCKRKYFYQFR